MYEQCNIKKIKVGGQTVLACLYFKNWLAGGKHAEHAKHPPIP